MSAELGNVAYDRDRSPFLHGTPSMPETRAYGEETARAVDGAVRVLVDAGFALATRILTRNRALLDATAERLLETETLNTPEIEALRKQVIAEWPLKVA
jgi:cell division protease FtsH